MEVVEFNTKKGLYIFELDNFETEFHSHPAIEIIIAKTGKFTLGTDSQVFTDLRFAIIAANQKHKLSSVNCKLKIIMLEHHNRLVVDNLKLAGIEFNNGIFLQKEIRREVNLIDKMVSYIYSVQGLNEYDSRISDTIEYLNQNDLEYNSVISTLRGTTKLSESRLSHLFKSTIGISLRKYLIWTRLKSTIKNHLDSKEDLFSALIAGGFYDQPHFSKSFKSMLGVKPSKAYNSRNLQVLSRPPL